MQNANIQMLNAKYTNASCQMQIAKCQITFAKFIIQNPIKMQNNKENMKHITDASYAQGLM